ncbi:hypothetical protein ACIRXL_04875 [Avibacterium paragallinarum]|uniref:hypothetical protein n=1 Tax=Avibacterium paragallinarum TaxID=728 RepID=UPI00397B72C4
MLTKRITLPDGTIFEFFASDMEQMALFMPDYAEKCRQKERRRRAKKIRRTQRQARKNQLKRQK